MTPAQHYMKYGWVDIVSNDMFDSYLVANSRRLPVEVQKINVMIGTIKAFRNIAMSNLPPRK